MPEPGGRVIEFTSLPVLLNMSTTVLSTRAVFTVSLSVPTFLRYTVITVLLLTLALAIESVSGSLLKTVLAAAGGEKYKKIRTPAMATTSNGTSQRATLSKCP